MAISPGIPTSFVPRQPAPDRKRTLRAGHNLFLLIALFVGGLAVIAAVGTYAYNRYLDHSLETKAEALALAQREVNEDQVEEFMRLRDRLVYGQDLLGSHIALSQMFDVLESQTLASVRFSSLELVVAEDNTAQIDIEGTARNFNALAAQSNQFAAEKGIRRAIFSGIVVNQNNTVNFRLTADLDAKLLVAEVKDAPLANPLGAPVMPAQTITVPTSTSTQP